MVGAGSGGTEHGFRTAAWREGEALVGYLTRVESFIEALVHLPASKGWDSDQERIVSR